MIGYGCEVAARTARAGVPALIAVYQADHGFDYYARTQELGDTDRFFSTRSVAGLDS